MTLERDATRDGHRCIACLTVLADVATVEHAAMVVVASLSVTRPRKMEEIVDAMCSRHRSATRSIIQQVKGGLPS